MNLVLLTISYAKEPAMQLLKRIFTRKRTMADLIKALGRATTRHHKSIIYKFKALIPCVDCRRRYNPISMTFDHNDRGTKLANISELVGRAFKQLIDEIKKCDLVCLNCHALREAYRDKAPATPAYIQRQAAKLKRRFRVI